LDVEIDSGANGVREQIEDVVNGPTKTGTRAREKALSTMQWFLATSDGRAVGLRGLKVALVSVDEAEIYDGRDNEEMKRRYFEEVLKVPLKVIPLSGECVEGHLSELRT
jgi:hypothetical protein